MLQVHLRIMLTLLFAGGIAVGQDNSQVPDASERIDVIKATGLPTQAARMIIPQISRQEPEGIVFRFQLLTKGKTPLKDNSVQLIWKGGKKSLKTDAKGNVSIRISDKNMTGLTLVVPKSTECKLIESPIVMAGPDGGPPPGATMILPGQIPEGANTFGPGIGGLPGGLFDTKLVSKAAPKIQLDHLIGAPKNAQANLAALRGKVVVLDFWATWCKPCIMGFPHLNELKEELGDEFVFIAVTDEDQETVTPVLKKHPLHTWVGLDNDGAMFEEYGVRSRPTVVIIDKQGRVAAVTSPQVVTASALRQVAEGKPWPADVEFSPAVVNKPIDISPEDISKEYELTADDLAPGGNAKAVVPEFLSHMNEIPGFSASSLAIQLELKNDAGEAAKRTSVTIINGDSKSNVRTNYMGRLTVELTEENAGTLRMLIPAQHRVIKPLGDAIGGTMSRSDAAGDVVELDPKSLLSMTDASDSFEVLYSPQHKTQAQDYVAVLAAIKSTTESSCGIKLGEDYGVALHDFPKGANIAVSGAPRFPFRADTDLKTDVLANWVLNHEWVEGTLVANGGLSYLADPNSRFIGDGLAELTSYEFCSSRGLDVDKHLRDFQDRIQVLLDNGDSEYNLLTQFPASIGRMKKTSPNEIAGYALSYVYWNRVKNAAGPEAIRKFIRHVQSEGITSSEVQPLLKKITGKDFPTTINLKEALSEVNGQK